MHEPMMPTSDAGKRYVALAEEHAKDFATRAAEHDRQGSFPFENFRAMQQSGVMAAMVPEQFGGLGVESVHDMVVGVSRLGHGDGSTALAANMHIVAGRLISDAWKAANAAQDLRAASACEGLLQQISAGEVIVTLLGTESGTDQLHPQVTATPTQGGYRINGRKLFGTLSPIANLFWTVVAIETEAGGKEIALPLIPRETQGLTILDNWDALGMRASGSNDIVFDDCFLSEEQFGNLRVPYGEWSPPWFNTIILGNLGLVGAFFGIAEQAREHVIHEVTTRRKKPSDRTVAERPTIQHWVAEMEINLIAARTMLDHCACKVDEFYEVHPSGTEATIADWHQLNKLFQVTKNFVCDRAVAIVDRAMTASGGSGYLSGSPLSRWYRDVRAGPIMQTYSLNEQHEYIAKVTLGLPMEMTD